MRSLINKRTRWTKNTRPVASANPKPQKKIAVHNVMKVIDVNASQVSKDTIEFLETYYRSYIDTMENMAEDLLNIVTAAEPDALSTSKHEHVREEIQQLAKLAEKHDAAYVRFTVI